MTLVGVIIKVIMQDVVTCVEHPVVERLQAPLCWFSRGNPGGWTGGHGLVWAFLTLPVEALQECCVADSTSRAF